MCPVCKPFDRYPHLVGYQRVVDEIGPRNDQLLAFGNQTYLGSSCKHMAAPRNRIGNRAEIRIVTALREVHIFTLCF